ncbi:MAG TPA: hypothetical protein VLX30_01860 [Burkholderiales bacterium]|nr:hypothetical protein [Burkholderiales bacterium]
MTTRLRITFAGWLTPAEVEVASDLIKTFGATIEQDRERRTLVIAPRPQELETLKEYLAVWETDDALSWSDAG